MPSLPQSCDCQALIKANKRLRKQNTKIIKKMNSMVYQHKYYMRTRGKSLKDRQIIKRQISRNLQVYRQLRKMTSKMKCTVGEGRYFIRVSRREGQKLRYLLKTDFRRFN